MNDSNIETFAFRMIFLTGFGCFLMGLLAGWGLAR